MKEKKNIERLFQEKFKDFEAQPSPELWTALEAKLQGKKKKRRVIPFWYRIAGVAAIFVLGLTVGNFFVKNPSGEAIEVVDGEKPENILPEQKNSGEKIVPEMNPEAIVSTEENLEQNKPTSGDISSEKNKDRNNNTTGLVRNDENSGIVYSSKTKKPKTGTNTRVVGKDKNSGIVYSSEKDKNQTKFVPNSSERKIAVVVKNQNNSDEKNTENIQRNNQYVNTQTIAENQKSPKKVSGENPQNVNTKEESVANVPNALEELLIEKEKQQVAATEEKINRWQITSTVAPVYFNSASNGSPINPEFSDNPKNFENNLSYGVGMAYNLNKRWAVRAGVNKLTLGYKTGDILYYPGLAARSENLNASASHIVIEDNRAANVLSFEASSVKTPGQISQTMGFIEVPMEVSYKVLDKKFGINLIGGMSTLFLNENNLSVISPGMSTSLGQATNLNDVSFSSNIGLGFDYHFWKNFQINLEPRFKYQFNTFNANDGGFKPYFIGIYTGLSYQF